MRAHRRPVHAVHVRRVEEVAHLPPRLVEDLPPLGVPVQRDLHVGEVEEVLGLRLARRRVDDGVAVALADQHLLAVGRDLVAGARADLRLGLLLEVVDVERGRLARARPPVVEAVADRGERPVVGGRRRDDARCGRRGRRRPPSPAAGAAVLLGLGRLRVGRLRVSRRASASAALGSPAFGSSLIFTSSLLGAKRALRVLRQGHEVDPRHVGVDVLELRLPVRRVEARADTKKSSLPSALNAGAPTRNQASVAGTVCFDSSE